MFLLIESDKHSLCPVSLAALLMSKKQGHGEDSVL